MGNLVVWFEISFILFFFNDTATTEIYTLSLHDALPIYHAFTGTADKGRKRVHGEVDADSSSLTTVSSLETTTQSTSVDVHHPSGTAEDHEPLNMLKMIFGIGRAHV